MGFAQSLEDRALKGDYDRTLKFGKSGGLWTVNNRGWDHEDTLGKGKHIEFDVSGRNYLTAVCVLLGMVHLSTCTSSVRRRACDLMFCSTRAWCTFIENQLVLRRLAVFGMMPPVPPGL